MRLTVDPRPPVSGIILAGGASQRMGTDKATLLVDGQPLIHRVADALARTPAITSITIVGGAPGLAENLPSTASTVMVEQIADDHPGAGPLAGTITGLRHVETSEALVVACDLPNLVPESLAALIAARRATDADYAVPLVRARRQWHCMAWSWRSVDHLVTAFASGEKSLRRAVGPLAESVLVLHDETWLTDLDTPLDLSNFDAG